LPARDRPTDLVHAPGQRIELPTDAGEVAALEQHIDPPKVGPQLGLSI
jgi:hypothetical protein